MLTSELASGGITGRAMTIVENFSPIHRSQCL